jgi:hypothetical protein
MISVFIFAGTAEDFERIGAITVHTDVASVGNFAANFFVFVVFGADKECHLFFFANYKV